MIVDMKKFLFIALAIIASVIIGNISPPEGLGYASMRFMGIFIGMLILLISQVMEDWVASIFTLTAMVMFNVEKLPTVFGPFGQSTIWLIIGVMAMAVGIGNSGLLKRISFKILTWFPSSYGGMILAMMCTGLVLTPMISSVLGKANLMTPVATSVSEQAGLKERSRAALGIFFATFMTTYIVGNAFLSGSGHPAILLGFMPSVKMDWIGWFTASSIWFVVVVLGTYIFCMTYCKPKPGEMEELPKGFFKERLAELGSISKNEKKAAVVVVLALAAWITQSIHNVDAGIVALAATAILAAFGLLPAKDFLAKVPWTLIVFIGTLLSISSLISSLGISKWLAVVLGPSLTPIVNNPWIFIPVLCLFTFLLRGVVISALASLTIVLAIFGPLMAPAGISIYVLLFTMYMATNVWYTDYQNPFILSILSTAGNNYVTYKEFRITSFAYMLMTTIGCMASIPLWQILGLIE